MAVCCMNMLSTLILTKREIIVEHADNPAAGMCVIIVKS
jgi:hypothetical protein